MLLNSSIYLVFLALTVALFWVAPKQYRVALLIAFGALYYAYVGFWELMLFIFLTFFTYGAAQGLRRIHDARKLIFGISVLVLVLAFFKYAGIAYDALTTHAENPLNIVLPLGISFFTFEFIHYLIEVYRGTIRRVDLNTFVAFAFFFPTRSAGPIKEYTAFRKQTKDIGFKPHFIYFGIGLLVLGFFQKIVIADPLIPITKDLASPENLKGPFDALFSLYIYSIRIYADFTGLTNIAMGSALLFGIMVPKNFNYPYLRTNIAQFWRSWHMSLSNWVLNYIYIPLGGNRKGEVRTILNLLAALLIIGVWHGGSLNFALWGLYHGVGLGIHRVWANHMGSKVPDNIFTKILGIVITFHFVTIGWALFVTTSFTDSLLILRTLFNV